jgi:NitT/TauT family transport system permease protein
MKASVNPVQDDSSAFVGRRSVRSTLYAVTERRVPMRLLQVVTVVVAIVVWQELGTHNPAVSVSASNPLAVAKWIGSWVAGNEAHGLDDLWVTLQEALYGWLIGLAFGTVLAVVLSAFSWIRRVIAPFVSVLNALPKIALAPLFILILGATLTSKVYFVAFGITFIMFFNVYGGLRSIDPVYIAGARILGASRLWLARDVYAPAIVGWVMTSLRLCSAWAIAGAVIVEYLGSSIGMGYVVGLGQQMLQASSVIGAIIVIALVAAIIDALIVQVEKRFTGWKLA